uniref:Chemokine interleukin-8-like domain-containing protein n=1 Tax=Gopherus agassizii TaxID=38772 RepID=A0A452IFA8_9SAUR
MNGKLVVAILALFLIYAVVLARMGNELRCQCIDLHSKFIPPRSIRDVKLTPSGPHCQNTEIIALCKVFCSLQLFVVCFLKNSVTQKEETDSDLNYTDINQERTSTEPGALKVRFTGVLRLLVEFSHAPKQVKCPILLVSRRGRHLA